MKLAFCLSLFLVLTLTACNNLVTRRATYSPNKASGPYTETRRTGKLPTREQLIKARTTPKPAGPESRPEDLGLPQP